MFFKKKLVLNIQIIYNKFIKKKGAIEMRVISKGVLRLLASYIAIPVALLLMPAFLFTQDVSAFDGLVNFIIGGENKL